MKTDLLITGIGQLVTAEGAEARRGRRMRELRVVRDAALAIAAGRVQWVGRAGQWTPAYGSPVMEVDLGGAAVVPGLIDPHTHAVWAGDRLADFEARSAAAGYEEILRAGGGIRTTVRSTSAASPEELARLATPRIERLLSSGAVTIEVKSGYGGSTAAELAALEAIERLQAEQRAQHGARLLATLLVHLPPSARSAASFAPNQSHSQARQQFLARVCGELIPAAARRSLASAVDVFVEKEAWSVEEAERIFATARSFGLAVKLHSDQFHSLGGVALAARSGALSVDHLEAAGEEEIRVLGQSSTVATILPGVSLHLGLPPAPGRRLIDAGAAVAVGTDLNPGSSPLFSAAAALGLAVRMNGLTLAEALAAGTVNAACALGFNDRGRIEPGCLADFLVLHSRDWRDLLYVMGANPVAEVWIGGRRRKRRPEKREEATERGKEKPQQTETR
ncbi:MAG: imidazolonepropionase [Acidobacteriota bacterium]